MAEPERLTETLIAAFREVALLVREVGFRPVVFGGLAAIVRGRGRFTDDIDLILDGPQELAPTLLRSLEAHGFQIPPNAAMRASRDGMMQVRRGLVKIDLLLTAEELSRHVASGAIDAEFCGVSIAVARAEDLVIMKLLAQRSQDMQDIHAILVRHRDALDIDRIRKWLPDLEEYKPGTTAVFERVKREFYDPLPPAPE